MENRRINILIVEDNPVDARLISEMLKEPSGALYNLTVVGQIKDALKILKEKKFDVVLLDLNLPDTDGFNGLERVIVQEQESPVIVFTGFDNEKAGIIALQKGAQDYIVKGKIQADVLSRSIRYAIERKRAEVGLRKAKEEWERTFDCVPDKIAILDNKYRILRVNKAMAQQMGLTADQCVGLECYKYVHGLSCSPAFCPHSLTLADGKQHIVEVYDERLGGHFVVSATPMFDKDGNITGSVHVARDINERKKAEDILRRDKEAVEMLVKEKSEELLSARLELERAKRLSDIGTLAATVAHELRNPLAAIGLAASNIKRKAKNPDLDKHIHNIEKKIAESDQIINNLLFYSRLKPPHCESLIIYNIINECIDAVQIQPKKNISFTIKIDSIKDAVIEADPFQLKEVFSNILNNACDAVSSEDGKIEIIGVKEGQPYEGFITVRVNDNGVGIHKEDLEKVFNPFFTTKAKGTGLGLSVCRQIIDMHGGLIGIESAMGKGTSVTVRLPESKEKRG